MIKEGTRAQVFHGTAEKTAGGLKKSDLVRGKDGRIKSKAAVEAAVRRMKEEGKKSMVEVFKAKKGTFKLQPKAGTDAHKKLLKKMNK